jgi:hypothetical protein
MRKARIGLLCLLVAGLAACGTGSLTAPEQPEELPPDGPRIQNCGYLGSGACPSVPTDLPFSD